MTLQIGPADRQGAETVVAMVQEALLIAFDLHRERRLDEADAALADL